MTDENLDLGFGTTIQLRYFSLARYALAEAFRVLDLRPGDKVLLPEYVCRDLLASLHQLSLTPVWYEINEKLSPSQPQTSWPEAKVVLAIDYFGFEQDLNPFFSYSKRTGAVVIEDNAHGFLSKSSAGHFLGTRATFGLFSFRKTLLIGHGAALAINTHHTELTPLKQLPFTSLPMITQIRVRRALRNWFRTRMLDFFLARGLRYWRKLRGLSEIPMPQLDAEVCIPGEANPSDFLPAELNSRKFNIEIQRRRTLYLKLEELAKSQGLKLVFPSLPENTVPYALPVFGEDIEAIKKIASSAYLDYFKWPDICEEVRHRALKHYTNIYLINLI
jgi:hypothetical protein